MSPLQILLLPGLHRAVPPAWAGQDARVVEQHDWARPLRGDWLMQLENAVLDAEGQVQLVAQGLACWLVASWAQFTQHTPSIHNALLIDPIDLRVPELQAQLPSWQRVTLRPLPFAATVLSPPESEDMTHHATWALAWGAQHHIPTDHLHTTCMKEETHGH